MSEFITLTEEGAGQAPDLRVMIRVSDVTHVLARIDPNEPALDESQAATVFIRGRERGLHVQEGFEYVCRTLTIAVIPRP